MNEERMLVLKLIEEGKITASEGAALLEALGESGREDASSDEAIEGEAGERREPLRDGMAQLAGDIRRAVESARVEARRAADVARTEAQKAAERARNEFEYHFDFGSPREALDRAADAVRKAFARRDGEWGSTESGFLHTITQTYDGELTPADRVAGIAANTHRGSIRVEGWDEAGYKLVLKAKVRARDEASAREFAGRAIVVEQGADGLRVEAPSGPHDAEGRRLHSVDIELWLPRTGGYRLQLKSTNGAVRVEDLNATA